MRVFISYRRGISSGWAGRFAETLRASLGASHVFLDVETLQPGVDFVQAISEALSSCDVLLAMIAPDWLSTRDAGGQRRLDDPNDFVRLEIATALARQIMVIPVLVGGATMPKQEELPPVLKDLGRRQAHELSDNRWDFDCQRLIDALRTTHPDVGKAGSLSPRMGANTTKAALVGGGLMAAAAAVTVVLAHRLQPQASVLPVGSWSGVAKEASGASFPVAVTIRQVCNAGAPCGEISVPEMPCRGEMSFVGMKGNFAEFSVDNFDASSNKKRCTPGAGELLRLRYDGNLEYKATYLNATGLLTRRDRPK